MKLPSVAFYPVNESLLPEDISKLPRAPKRIMEVLKKGSSLSVSAAPKTWSLDFCLSPTAFNLSDVSTSHLGSMTFEKTSLISDGPESTVQAKGTGEYLDLPTSLAFRSIGYKSEALFGFSELGISFNDGLGTIPNDQFGRVIGKLEANPSSPNSEILGHLPGLYCAGWVKRGPTGVIASTMQDAFSTAEVIARDWYAQDTFLNGTCGGSGYGWDGVKEIAEKRNCRRVSWEDWKRIDAAEQGRGQAKGKEREKFTRIEDMLAILD